MKMTNKKKEVLIIIPAYNEGKTIGDLLEKLNATFKAVEPKKEENSRTSGTDNKKKEEKNENKKGFFGKVKDVVDDFFDEE